MGTCTEVYLTGSRSVHDASSHHPDRRNSARILKSQVGSETADRGSSLDAR